MAGGNPLSPENLIGHTKDATYFHVPKFFDHLGISKDGHVEIPQFATAGKTEPNAVIESFDLQITKFMLIEVFVAVCCVAIFAWVASKVSTGERPKGGLWNLFETFLLFIRDQVARPAIGHGADKFLPFLWTMFFFVLGCNLLGMVPWAGSPTGAFACTVVLALLTFATVIISGSKEMGVLGFWKNQVPHMDLPVYMFPLKIGIFLIEVLGLFIKHFVLAVRLFANMLAGHVVLGALLAFISVIAALEFVTSYSHPLMIGVSIASILGALAISMLELFVAFLQAYIFTFLSALFIGMAVHEH